MRLCKVSPQNLQSRSGAGKETYSTDRQTAPRGTRLLVLLSMWGQFRTDITRVLRKGNQANVPLGERARTYDPFPVFQLIQVYNRPVKLIRNPILACANASLLGKR